MSASPNGQRRFGHYELQKELGRGAQGVVWLALDSGLQRLVALKMLTDAGLQSAEARERFQREAALTSRIEHPGICGIHEVGAVDAVPFIAMQFVRGTTLAAILAAAKGQGGEAGKAVESITITRDTTKGELQDLMRLIERAANALHAAHEAGLVHRDIKPANIMVTPDGDPVLLDFGLARDATEEGKTLTQSGQIMGTPAYLAPEQILAERGGVDRRADVYSLGVTLFECLTLQRPFDAPSWDQLFHKILAGNPPNPRSLNPRIPQDLRTVIEVAIDRDPQRRYATAAEFAEDLRRVRAFEPIQARAASVWTRMHRWSRRRPGVAASLAGGILSVVGVVGLFATQEWNRRAAVQSNLAEASDSLQRGEYGVASGAVERALEREPDSLRAHELRGQIERAVIAARQAADRADAMAKAGEARAEAEQAQERYQTRRNEIEGERGQVARERAAVYGTYVDDAAHAAFAQREAAVKKKEEDAEADLFAAQQAPERAASFEAPWGGPLAETETARATFFLRRWRKAIADGDEGRAALWRAQVESHDPGGVHREELFGRGTLQITVVPPDAELHLFRYRDINQVGQPPNVPRLVPVPTTGIDPAADGNPAVLPGTAALVVQTVADGSLAAAIGLQPGDLIVQVDGAPCDGLWVHLPAPAENNGQVLRRVVQRDGKPMADAFDWSSTPRGEGASQIEFHGGEPGSVPFASVVPVQLAQALGTALAVPLRLACWRQGELVDLLVPAGQTAGVSVEPTVYPLILGPASRIGSSSREVDPGSYLVLARAPGCADQRVPVAMPRRGSVDLAIALLAAASGPPGYAYVPPGVFRAGGDPLAHKPEPAHDVALDGFWIARREVSNDEWFAFLNDPSVRDRIQPDGKPLTLVPRDVLDNKVLAKKREDGTWEWAAYLATTGQSPVLGISWYDADAYVAWRNARAEATGEPWLFQLPSAEEWEKAARGVDGRAFPWGNRFDLSLAITKLRKAAWLIDAPSGFEPRDESVYGVLDMAGSREEWLRDRAKGPQDALFAKRGGHWGSNAEIAFRTATRPEAPALRAVGSQGLRLVARRR